jgi:hypothetical protein
MRFEPVTYLLAVGWSFNYTAMAYSSIGCTTAPISYATPLKVIVTTQFTKQQRQLVNTATVFRKGPDCIGRH